MPDRLRLWWRHLVHRANLEREMAEELAFHIERRAEDLEARGMSRDAARRAARLEFGSVEKYKEETRESLGLRLIDETIADLRFAWRTFLKNRGFVAAAVATLALGIGTNTAVFTVMDAIVLRSLPVPHPEELIAFDTLHAPGAMVANYSGNGRPGPGGTSRRTSFPMFTFERFQQYSTTLSDVWAIVPVGMRNLVVGNEADTAATQLVSGAYYQGLGVRAVVGRTLRTADDRFDAEPVAVISHRYWQRRFAANPNIVGQAVFVNRTPFIIVGVTEPGFEGTDQGESETFDLTLPITHGAAMSNAGRPFDASYWWVRIMGRLKPGAASEQVLGELRPHFEDTVRESWAARPPTTRFPDRTGMPTLRVNPGAQGPDGPSPFAFLRLAAMFVVTGAVLLIGCVNLANLMLVRSAAQRQEMTMRTALGASRGRLIRQLLIESLLLSTLGAIAGALLAIWTKDSIPGLFEDGAILDARLDWRALAFTAILASLTALAFGVGPALQATRIDLGGWLKTASTGRLRGRMLIGRTLIGVQVAATLVLLVSAGLFVRTLINFSRVDVGFDARNMLVFQIDSAPAADPASILDLYERLIAAIEDAPGVKSATLSAIPVIARSEWNGPVRTDDGKEPRSVNIQSVRWNFFETFGIPLLAGRSLSSSDGPGQPRIAVINATMARSIFNDANPIGRHFQPVDGQFDNAPFEVVGIVGDAKYARLEEPVPPTFYLPHTQAPQGRMTVEVRTAGDAASVTPAIRASVRRVDPALPLVGVRTQEEQMARTIRDRRVFAMLTAIAGTIGLLLASVGLYGIVAYDARTRTNEIGIRMALGARAPDVVRLVLRQTATFVTVGAFAGGALAIAGSRLIVSQLFGVVPTDLVTIAGAALVLVGVAFLAAFVPARRASKLDPSIALRYE